jgi:hypothetical protein
MKRLLLATLNQGKIREFAEAFAESGIDVVGLDAIPDHEGVEETGETFEANARLKADHYSSLRDSRSRRGRGDRRDLRSQREAEGGILLVAMRPAGAGR